MPAGLGVHRPGTLTIRLTFAGRTRFPSIMRSTLAAALLAALPAAALARDAQTGGPVTEGGFGMSGAEYYGDIRSRMPFTNEAPPHQIGIRDVERVRDARRRMEVAGRRAEARRHPQRRHSPHG